MKKKLRIIEFVGMPGSGKSFFQRKILKKFRWENIHTNDYKKLSKTKKIIYIFLFILNNKYFALKTIFFLIFKVKKKIRNRHFYYFYNEIALRESYENFRDKTDIINDEGFLYRSAIYFDRKFSNFELENYLKKIPRIDLIIYLYSKKKTNFKRTLKRTNGYKYTSYDYENYHKKEKLLKKMVLLYKKKRMAKFISIHNTKVHTKKNIEIISKALKYY